MTVGYSNASTEVGIACPWTRRHLLMLPQPISMPKPDPVTPEAIWEYYPFENEQDFRFVQWCVERDLSKGDIDSMLKHATLGVQGCSGSDSLLGQKRNRSSTPSTSSSGQPCRRMI